MKVHIEIPTTANIGKRHKASMHFRNALRSLLTATNPYSSSSHSGSQLQLNNQQPGNSIDCCICLSCIGPFQALFIAPCSHCFHYKCIRHVLKESLMFPCPVCRQVANLDASVSMESLFDFEGAKQDKSNQDATENAEVSEDEEGFGEEMDLDGSFKLEQDETKKPKSDPIDNAEMSMES